jgi:hypothetical protein
MKQDIQNEIINSKLNDINIKLNRIFWIMVAYVILSLLAGILSWYF